MREEKFYITGKIYADNGYAFIQKSIDKRMGQRWMLFKILSATVFHPFNKSGVKSNEHTAVIYLFKNFKEYI